MGLPGVWKIIAVGLLTLSFPSGHPALEETHAVTGTLLSQADDSPIAGATVTAVDKSGGSITSDKTSNRHGLYLLSVPVSREQYALLFQHPDFMEEISAYIDNKANHKFGDMKLVPASVSGNMTASEAEQVANRAETFDEYGRENNLPIYRAVAQRNLQRLLLTYNPTDANGMRVRTRIELQFSLMQNRDPVIQPGILKPPATIKPPTMDPRLQSEPKIPEVRVPVKPPKP